MEKQLNQKYFLQLSTDTDSSLAEYCITQGYQGYTVMIISQKSRKVITSNGWIETLHQGLEKVEIADDQINVLLYYKGQESPLIIEIPQNVDSSYFDLTEYHIEKVLLQMKEKGLTYDDFWAEYYSGTNTVYGYYQKKQSFIVTKIDVITGSFCIEEEISPEDLKNILRECASLNSFREQNFKF